MAELRPALADGIAGPSDTLEGRSALITGAGRGIGRASALDLARAGVRVSLLARSRDELNDTASRIRDGGGRAVVIPADLGDPRQRSRAVGQVLEEYGVVDVLVNNDAVVWPLAASVSVDPAQWAAAINIGLVAVAALSFGVLPAMLEQRWGRIVNVSSGIAEHPTGMLRANAYVTSKAALEAHTLNLAAELADTGVRVNAFRPGSVDTGMQAWIRGQDPDRVGADLHERFARSHQQGTLMTAEQSARTLIRHLTSDDTGQIWNAGSQPTPN